MHPMPDISTMVVQVRALEASAHPALCAIFEEMEIGRVLDLVRFAILMEAQKLFGLATFKVAQYVSNASPTSTEKLRRLLGSSA